MVVRRRLLRLERAQAAADPALTAWSLTRLGYLLLTALVVAVSARAGRDVHGPLAMLRAWEQWDAGWYERISRLGYFAPAAANFFPLYPMLVALVAAGLGHGTGPVPPDFDAVRTASALLVSNAAALVALGAAAALARELRGSAAATLKALAAYPYAFFLTAPYTESLFLALAGWSLVFSRRRAWLPAAGCACLAGLTRPTAAALVAPMAWEAWSARRDPRRALPALAAAGAPLAGLAVYAAYLGARFGDPLAMVHSQERDWHHHLAAPWQTAALVAGHLVHHPVNMLVLDTGLVLAGVALLAAGARRLPLSLTLFSAAVIGLAVAAPLPGQHDVIPSMGRYLLAALPLFVVLGGLLERRRRLEVAYLVAAGALQAALLIAFLLGGPVM